MEKRTNREYLVAMDERNILISETLNEIKKDVKEIRQENVKIALRVNTLETKSRQEGKIWGTITGLASSIFIAILTYFLKK